MISKNKVYNPVVIYFIIWCLYNLQGALYSSGGVISRSLLLILLFWSLCIVYKVVTGPRNQPNYFKALNVFLLTTTLYGLLLMLSGQSLYITEGYMNIKTNNFDYLKHIYMSFFPMYVYYYYTRKGNLNEKHLKYFTIALLLVLVVNYFYQKNQLMLLAANATDGVTLNIGYEFLALIPLIWFWNKAPRYQYLLLLICMFFIIICMKRGAILIGIICFIYFLYATFKQSTGRLRYTIILFSIIAVLVTSAIITNMLASNDYFAYRLEQTLEGDSSNRDELYSTYFKYFISERNFFKFIFGNGANATLKVGFNFAHNDWLELAINNGICGIMIYLWCFISLIKDFIRAKKFYRFEANAILLQFIIIFTSSLFSMSYASIDHAITITMGYALARVYR